MAGRAAGHRHEVGRMDCGHVGEANPRGRHLGSDHVDNCDKLINRGKRDGFRSSAGGKEYKEKYKYNYGVLEPVIMQ